MESASSGEERPNSFRLSCFQKSSTYQIQVEYKTHDGKKKKSKLLTSGFWGLARHLNYVFELLLALSWRYLLVVCLLLTDYFQPSFAWPWNTSLCLLWVPIDPTSSQVSWNLCDPCKRYLCRVFRDEEKCSGKYGAGWKTYCEQVQRIIARAWKQIWILSFNSMAGKINYFDDQLYHIFSLLVSRKTISGSL